MIWSSGKLQKLASCSQSMGEAQILHKIFSAPTFKRFKNLPSTSAALPAFYILMVPLTFP